MSSTDSILARDTLGAFVRETHAVLAGAPSGALAGLVFGAKDLYAIAGHRTGFGSPDWLATHPQPAPATALAVQRLVDAGATLVGKTHTAELAYSLNGENAHYGTPVNPNAPGRDTGGSSSGSAAATAGRLVDFALGSDTGGSVRLPASFCGVYGMRPSHGRVPLEGACALAPSFDTAGWFARDPGVLERAGRVLLADDAPAREPGRLLHASDAFGQAGPAVAAALAPALARIERLLGPSERVVVAPEGLHAWAALFRIIQGHEAWQTLGHWITTARPRLGPGIRERFEFAATIDREQLLPALSKREEIALRMERLLAGDALLVLPSAPGPATRLGAPAGQIDALRMQAMALLCVAGLARLPQLSLPFASIDGCPLGISLVAARGNDTLLLAVAQALGAP